MRGSSPRMTEPAHDGVGAPYCAGAHWSHLQGHSIVSPHHRRTRARRRETAMAWIEALKYGLTALAALFGIWAALRLKAEGTAPSERGARLLERFMIFCVLLLVLSGLLAVFDGYFLQEHRRARELQPILARMDQTVGDKLDIGNDAFAPM